MRLTNWLAKKSLQYHEKARLEVADRRRRMLYRGISTRLMLFAIDIRTVSMYFAPVTNKVKTLAGTAVWKWFVEFDHNKAPFHACIDFTLQGTYVVHSLYAQRLLDPPSIVVYFKERKLFTLPINLGEM